MSHDRLRVIWASQRDIGLDQVDVPPRQLRRQQACHLLERPAFAQVADDVVVPALAERGQPRVGQQKIARPEGRLFVGDRETQFQVGGSRLVVTPDRGHAGPQGQPERRERPLSGGQAERHGLVKAHQSVVESRSPDVGFAEGAVCHRQGSPRALEPERADQAGQPGHARVVPLRDGHRPADVQSDQRVMANGSHQVEGVQRAGELVGATFVPRAGGMGEDDRRHVGFHRPRVGLFDCGLGGLDDLRDQTEHPQRDGHPGEHGTGLLRRGERKTFGEPLVGHGGGAVQRFEGRQCQRRRHVQLAAGRIGKDRLEPVPGSLGLPRRPEQFGGLQTQPAPAGITARHAHGEVEHPGGRFDPAAGPHPLGGGDEGVGECLVRSDRALRSVCQPDFV